MYPPISIGHIPAPTGRGGLTVNKFDEDQLQIALVHLLRLDFKEEDLLFCAIPNGGKRDKKQITRGKNKGKWYSPEGQKLKAMGMLAGMTDMAFWWPNNDPSLHWQSGIIEIKTEAPESRLSDDQKVIRDRAWKMKGHWAVVRTYEALRDQLVAWGAKCQYRVNFTSNANPAPGIPY